MKNEKILKPFTPPSLNDFLQEKYWAVHEASFVLTKWPTNNLFRINIGPALEQKKIDIGRSFLYLQENLKVNPERYGKAFVDIFNQLNQAIEDRDLKFRTILVKGAVYFITPFDTVMWALTKGHRLPINLQEAIGILQDNSDLRLPSKTRSLLPKKVKQKIIAQFMLSQCPDLERTFICNVIRVYLGIKGSDLTAIRKCINELFYMPGRKGRRKKNHVDKAIEAYSPKAMDEIVKIDSEGRTYYNFLLLMEAMNLLSYFKVNIMDSDEIRASEKQEFFDRFMNDDVVALYHYPNKYVLGLMWLCASSAWEYLSRKKSELERKQIVANMKTEAIGICENCKLVFSNQ